MPHFNFKRRTRPHWWPENEPWPPPNRLRHSPFFRRLGCFFMLFNLIGFTVFVGAVVAIMRSLGLLDVALPVISYWTIPLVLLLIMMLVALVGAGWFSLRRYAAPLDELLSAAERVADGDYSVEVDEQGPRAVRSLQRAFNNMASRLYQSNSRRRELLADVTHELRTPLTVIQGNLEGMLDSVYPADETNLRALLDETNILSRLIDDLRTLALAESGALQLKKEPTDLADLIRDVAAAFRSQAEAEHITLTVNISDSMPWLNIDPGRIRQVLINLLINAFRYTPAGGTVTFRYELDEQNAVIELQDTGKGIPAEDLPHVFQRFYKSTDSGGMGLGLAIAKHLVDAHGGQISVSSLPGQGTTLRVSFPLEI